MSLGQAYETDDASPGQRARRSELQAYCKRKGISVAGDATKDDMLKLIDVQPMVKFAVPDIKRKNESPDLGSHTETDAEQIARLEARLADLKPKIFSTSVLDGTAYDETEKLLDDMPHHLRKKWLVKACSEKGIECRFPTNRGKGPEVLAECKRVAAM